MAAQAVPKATAPTAATAQSTAAPVDTRPLIFEAILKRPENPDSLIPGLEWNAATVKVERKQSDPHPWVTIEGRYPPTDSRLLWRSNVAIPRSREGRFRLRFPIAKPTTAISFSAVGPRGDVRSELVRIILRDPRVLEKPRPQAPRPAAAIPPQKRHSWIPSAGVSLISYQQTNIPDVSETMLTLKLNYLYQLPSPQWNLGANVFGNVLPLLQHSGTTAIRFLGINGRVGYNFKTPSPPWQMSLMAGAYFTTSLVPSSAFGYQNMTGPQLLGAVRRSLSGDRGAGLYLKFAPIASNFSLLSLENREVAAGVSYSFRLPNRRSASVSLDAAKLNIEVPASSAATAVSIESTSLSLSLGYPF